MRGVQKHVKIAMALANRRKPPCQTAHLEEMSTCLLVHRYLSRVGLQRWCCMQHSNRYQSNSYHDAKAIRRLDVGSKVIASKQCVVYARRCWPNSDHVRAKLTKSGPIRIDVNRVLAFTSKARFNATAL